MSITPGGDESGPSRFTYRLRVSSRSRAALDAEWSRCRWVWNESVARSRRAHVDGEACGPARLDRMLTAARRNLPWLREGSSVAQQQVVRDFAKSRTKALRDIKNGVPSCRRVGMPKAKKKCASMPSMNYTRRGFCIRNRKLHLANGITLTVVWSRELPADPSSVRVYRDNLGHWYCSFVVNARFEPLPETGAVIGVDWGVKDIATTTSDAHDLPHPEFGRKAAVKLSRYQRMMARRKPSKGQCGSAGYKSAKKMAAKQYKKIVRQRRDTAGKWAKNVVRDHDVVAAEDFRPKFLAKSTMARKAADAAIGSTKAVLVHMARKHQRVLHLVNPANTTTDCGHCTTRAKRALPLSQRIYTCTACGVSSPRDKNSARVMLIRAGLTPADVDRVRPGQS